MSGNNQRRNTGNRNNPGRRMYQTGSGPRNNSRERGGSSYRDNKPRRDDDRSLSNAPRAAINPWQTGTAPSAMMPQFQTFQPAPIMIPQGVQRVDFGNQGFRAGYGSGQPAKMAMGGMGFNTGAMIGVQSTPLMTFQQQMPSDQQRSRGRDYNSRNNNMRNRSPQNSNRNENRNSAYYGNSRSNNTQDRRNRPPQQRSRGSVGDRISTGSRPPKSRSRSRSRDIKDRLGKKEGDGGGIRRRLSDNISRKRPRRERSPAKDSIEEDTPKSESKDDDVNEEPEVLDEVGETIDFDEKEVKEEEEEEEEAIEVKSEKDETKEEPVTVGDDEKENNGLSARSKSRERSTKDRPKEKKYHSDDFPSDALKCHICDLHLFTSKTGFIRHLQGNTHEKMAKLFHAKNAAKLELLEVTVKLIEMRQRDKCLRETGNRHPTIKKTIEHDLMRQLVKPHYCCDTRFSSPFDLEEHKLTLVHLRNEHDKGEKKEDKEEVDTPAEDEDADQNVDVMIDEAKLSAKLCPINLAEPPLYDPSEIFGLEFLNKYYHYRCSLCKKNNSPKSVMPHCQSFSHYESAMDHFRMEKEKKEKEERAAKRKRKEEEEEEEEGKEKEKDADLATIGKNVLDDFVKNKADNDVEDERMEDETHDENADDEECKDEIQDDEMQDDDYGDLNEDQNEGAHENYDLANACTFGAEIENGDNLEDEEKNDVEEDDYEYRNYKENDEDITAEIKDLDDENNEEKANVEDETALDALPDEPEEPVEEEPTEESPVVAVVEETTPRTRRRRGRPSLARN